MVGDGAKTVLFCTWMSDSLPACLTRSTRRATIVARAQSSRNSEGHYNGRGNVINVINLKLIPSWAFPRTRNIPSGMS